MRYAIIPALMLALSAQAHAQAPGQNPAAPTAAPAARPQPGASPTMRALTPGLAGYTDAVLFGEVWKRPGLAPRDRSLVTISALIAAGRAAQLTSHLGIGLDNGLTPSEISGIITQMAFYAGWPAAVSAVAVTDEVFRQRGIDRASIQGAAGAALPQAGGSPGSPLSGYTDRVLLGDLWRRADLSPRDRSLSTIAGLIAMGEIGALPPYLARGLEAGLTESQLAEAINHLAFYTGWPKATAAAPLLATAVAARAAAPAAPPAAKEQELRISRAGSTPGRAPAEHFTGEVRVDTPFSGTGEARIRGATVHFTAGARTAWHTHPLGQTLVIVSGRAWVQRDGGAIEEANPGDIVFIPPGVRHWHGASPTAPMTHVAMTEVLDGVSVTWAEKVGDAEYARGAGKAP